MPPGVQASIAADRVYRKPVLNTENGYEFLAAIRRTSQVHHTDKVRQASWQIVCAGGYFSAGFAGTQGNGNALNRPDAPNRHPFVLKDEGAADQLAAIYEFFTGLPFWKLELFDGVKGEAVALAERGKLYVVYLPRGGKVELDLGARQRNDEGAVGSIPARARYSPAPDVRGGSLVAMRGPDDNDWTLVVKKDRSEVP